MPHTDRAPIHRRHFFPKWLLATLCLALLLPAAPSMAAQVAPNVVLIGSGERGAQVTVHNPGLSPIEVEVTLTFGYEDSDEEDKVRTVYPEDGTTHDKSAVNWLRVYPQRVIVGPGARQALRLFSRPPQGLAEGEYWARMQVQTRPTEMPSRAVESTDEVRVRVGVTTRQRIPVFVRIGEPEASLRFTHVGPLLDDGGMSPEAAKAEGEGSEGEGEDGLEEHNEDGSEGEDDASLQEDGALPAPAAKTSELIVRYRADLEGSGAFLGMLNARLFKEGKILAEETVPIAFFNSGWRRIRLSLFEEMERDDLEGALLTLETLRDHPAIQTRQLLPGTQARWEAPIRFD